jgi:hypothetical protein
VCSSRALYVSVVGSRALEQSCAISAMHELVLVVHKLGEAEPGRSPGTRAAEASSRALYDWLVVQEEG